MRPSPTSCRTLLTSVVLGSILLSSTGCGEATGLSRPDLTLRDTDGNTVSLADLDGKAVLLNFWFLG